MDPSVEDVGGGAAWRTGIVGEAGTGGVEAAGGEAGAGCSGGGNCGGSPGAYLCLFRGKKSYFEAKCDFLPPVNNSAICE